jgi:perosamine synthetase
LSQLSKTVSTVLLRNSAGGKSVRRAHVPNTTLTPQEVVRAWASPLPVDSAERQIESMLGFPAVLFASARGALASAIATLASSEGVVIPAYTCAAVANASISAGHLPAYVDVDDRGLVPSESWPKGRLAIVQDTYGSQAPTPEALVIRDDAHGLLLQLVAASSVTITSFEHSKSLSAGQGGLALTTDGELAAELRRVRDQAAAPTRRSRHVLFTLLTLATGRLEYQGRHRFADPFGRIAYRVDLSRLAGQSQLELQGSGVDAHLLGRPNPSVARLMVGQLRRVHSIGAHRSRIVELYDRAAGIERPAESLVRYPMVVSNPAAFEDRLLQHGWDVRGRWFSAPLHPAGANLERLGYERGSAPVAERLAATVVNLPTHPLVSDQDARSLIELALECDAQPIGAAFVPVERQASTSVNDAA